MILLNANMDEGLIILIVGMGIVFSALILLHAVFQFVLPPLLTLGRKPIKKESVTNTVASAKKEYTSGEQIAAASAAIYLFLEEAHDEENAIVTINQVSKSYSPWSSKIYVTHRFNNR